MFLVPAFQYADELVLPESRVALIRAFAEHVVVAVIVVVAHDLFAGAAAAVLE